MAYRITSEIFLIITTVITLCSATSLVCRDGRFACENRGACIPHEYVCDGRNDCSDGSDETNCANGRPCKIKNCSHNCYNDPYNGAKCNCPAGFILSSNRITCQDINECDTLPALCSQNCTNTPGSYLCTCYKGFTRNNDGSCKSESGEIIRPKLVCAGEKHPCDNGESCISFNFVCDNSIDCSDGSDEKNCQSGKFCKAKQCEQLCKDETNQYPFLNTFGHSAKIADKVQYGTKCSCREGYKLSSNNVTCDDIDECASVNHKCNHICKNTVGSYECACMSGYYLDSVENDCKAIGTYPLLYFATKDSVSIHNVALNVTYSAAYTLQIVPELSNFRIVKSMTFDSLKKRMLYLEMGVLGNIIKGQKDSKIFKVDKFEMIYPFVYALSIDFDWITGNVYVTDAGSGKIMACALEIKECVDLVHNEKSRPTKILLNPLSRKMYWINNGENSGIYYAGMDGSNVTLLVPSYHTLQRSIALDLPSDSLILSQKNGTVEEIKAIDLITLKEWTLFSNRTVPVIDAPIQEVAVFEDTVYFSTNGFKPSIWSIPKYSKTSRPKLHLALEHGQHQITAMIIRHPLLTPSEKYENPCLGVNCTDICLLSPNEEYSCENFNHI